MEERIRYLFELQTAQALASLDRLRGKILNADLAMKKMNATTMTATANLMQMSKGGINRAAQSTQALSKGSVKASKGLGAMAGKAMLAMVGVAALMRVARMLGEEVTKSASAFREFEVRMAEVSTIVQDTDTHMLGLSAGVSSMSKQFGKSTSDLSRGLYDILSASVPVEDSLQMLEISAKAAAAGLTSVEKSVDVLTSVMNAYGLTVDQMTKVSDVMFKAVIHGKFRFEDLASSLGYVMPIAAQVGVRFEEIAAAIASATRQGQHVDMVARGLALSIQNIIKPSEGAQKAAEELSLSLSQASLRAYGLEGFMEKLAIATQGNAGAISEIIPNMRSYRVAMVLAANDASEMGKDVDRMTDSLDATEEAFEKVADTVDMSRNILVEYKNEMQRMVGSSTAELEKFTVKWDMFKASVLGFFTSGGTSIDSGKHPIAAALSGISPILGSITAGFLNTADASEMAAQTAAENIRKQVEALNAAPKQDIYEAFKSGETLIARPYDVLANDLIEAREEATALGLVLAEMKEMGAPESSAAMRQLTLDYQNAVDAVLEAEVAIGEWDGALKTASDAVEYYADSIDIVWEEMGRLTEQIEDLTQKYKENAAQIPIDYMNHWVSLLQEDSKYQEEFNEAVATGGENYDWYTAEMGEAITTIREYEQQTKETTATQNEFNEALARNRIETMKLQLIGMMRRRGNTRAELRALKSLSIQRTEMQIEEAQNK
ncbi:MAG: phage tail tape measure protein, partial [Candidatus Asgardarchaeum californiense]